jgi:hypothetical protein
MTMPPDAVRGIEGQMEAIVTRRLRENWCSVVAVAREIATMIASGGNRIEAWRIGEVVRSADPVFYENIKANLETGSE